MNRRLKLILATLSLIVVSLTVVSLSSAPTLAADSPTGSVVLTVTGDITKKNCDEGFAFDLPMLEGLGLVNCAVADPWLGQRKYSGVSIASILAYVGVSAEAVRVDTVASDNKVVTLALSDVRTYPIILATQDNAKAVSKKLGGPVKLVFPYDSHPEVAKAYDKNCWNWFVVKLAVTK